MSIYADSSFLVSCYMPDANTARATAVLPTFAEPVIFTALHALEISNAFQLAVFRRHQTPAEAVTAWRNVQNDLHSPRLLRTSVRWGPAIARATLLTETHSATIGTRSLDILHIALALSLGADQFLSFDSRQRALASAVGLHVTP